MRKKLSFLLFGLLIAVSIPIFAQDLNDAPPPPPPLHGDAGMGEHHGGHGFREFAALHLSKDQKTRLHAIMLQSWHNLLPLRLEEKKKRIELAELYAGPNLTREAVEQKLGEISSLRSQEADLKTDTSFNIMSILTPEQQQIFSQFIAMRMMHGDKGDRRHFGDRCGK